MGNQRPKFDKKISKLKTVIKPSKPNPILKQIDVVGCLEALQKSLFLFLLAKHPAMLLIYVCKRYYVGAILNAIFNNWIWK